MQTHPRFTINRHLIVLMPRQPVLDWIMRVDPDPLNLTLEDLRRDQNAFLIPETVEGREEAERWILQRWRTFFESALSEWFTKEDWWPQKRTPKMFKEWYEIQYHSMVWDMVDGETIEHEDWDSLQDGPQSTH